jgi:adenylate cyclase
MDYESITEPTECRMIIAVADVAGFAAMCKTTSDLDVFKALDEFDELVGEVVSNAGGRVLKCIGDAPLMLFPEENAKEAIAALQDLKERAQSLWSSFDQTCSVRVKAHVGPVACGPLGPRGQKTFDAIGNTVNDLFRMPWDGPEISDELKQLVEQ